MTIDERLEALKHSVELIAAAQQRTKKILAEFLKHSDRRFEKSEALTHSSS